MRSCCAHAILQRVHEPDLMISLDFHSCMATVDLLLCDESMLSQSMSCIGAEDVWCLTCHVLQVMGDVCAGLTWCLWGQKALLKMAASSTSLGHTTLQLQPRRTTYPSMWPLKVTRSAILNQSLVLMCNYGAHPHIHAASLAACLHCRRQHYIIIYI